MPSLQREPDHVTSYGDVPVGLQGPMRRTQPASGLQGPGQEVRCSVALQCEEQQTCYKF